MVYNDKRKRVYSVGYENLICGYILGFLRNNGQTKQTVHLASMVGLLEVDG